MTKTASRPSPAIASDTEQAAYISCDRDQACDYAQWAITTNSGDIFLCGHHYNENQFALLAAGYKPTRIREERA